MRKGTGSHIMSDFSPLDPRRIPVAVVGANGYAGEQLMRVLLRHPNVHLVALTSRAETGRRLTEVMPRFRHWPGADALNVMPPDIGRITSSGAKVAFLALPHGVAAEFAVPLVAQGLRVIDLSADFRLEHPAVYEEYYEQPHPAPGLLQEAVYGLPEIHAERIRTAL